MKHEDDVLLQLFRLVPVGLSLGLNSSGREMVRRNPVSANVVWLLVVRRLWWSPACPQAFAGASGRDLMALQPGTSEQGNTLVANWWLPSDLFHLFCPAAQTSSPDLCFVYFVEKVHKAKIWPAAVDQQSVSSRLSGTSVSQSFTGQARGDHVLSPSDCHILKGCKVCPLWPSTPEGAVGRSCESLADPTPPTPLKVQTVPDTECQAGRHWGPFFVGFEPTTFHHWGLSVLMRLQWLRAS